MKLELKYDSLRRFYLRFRVDAVPHGRMPADFINVVRKKDRYECSTMTLLKRNQRVLTALPNETSVLMQC